MLIAEQRLVENSWASPLIIKSVCLHSAEEALSAEMFVLCMFYALL